MNPSALDAVRVVPQALPRRRFAELRRHFPDEHFQRLWDERFAFYRTTFWYPLSRPPANVFEHVVDELQAHAAPSHTVVGAEWWFSVTRINATPQWILPCHFDRNDLSEKEVARIRHPEKASVLFLHAVPYGDLVITDQVLTERGTRPRQPEAMRFVRPASNKYAVFPGHLLHGVIGRMWRPLRADRLRMTMAINWWTERPVADYLHESADAPEVFGLPA